MDEFQEYYAFISASIDNDQYFELMMNNAWRINEGANKNWEKKGWAGNSNDGAQKAAGSRPQRFEEQKSRPGTAAGG